MTSKERKALAYSYLGRTVNIRIDRSPGSAHPKHPELIYPVNYGYIPGVKGGDGEELDVYLLGVDIPVKEYKARVIGAILRHNDSEDKLIAAPEGMSFTKEEAEKAVRFRAVLLRTVFRNTVYLERGMPYFVFVFTNAVLVRKIDKA